MPEHIADGEHPAKWDIETLIAWSETAEDGLYAIDIDSPPESIKETRGKAISVFLRERLRRTKEGEGRVRERVKMHYEMGTSMKQICDSYRVKRKDVEKWAKQEKWKLPVARKEEPKVERPAYAEALALDADVQNIERAEEVKLPLAEREMREQKRMMNLRGSQWENVPFDKIPQALRMRLVRQARRVIERMEQLDEDEIIEPNMIRNFKAVAEVLEKVAPIPEEVAPRGNSLLHINLFSDTGLPVKKADVTEISD